MLQWSPDGKKILFGIANGEVHVFDNTGNFIVSPLGFFSLWNFIVLVTLKRRPKKDTNERESKRKREERRERKEREWCGGGGGGVNVRGQLVEREKHINNVCSVQENGRVACVG